MHAVAVSIGLLAAALTASVRALPYGIGAVLGTVLIVTDLRWHRLPDLIVLPAVPSLTVALVAVAASDGTWHNLGRAALGALALTAWYLLLALTSQGGMGEGDTKLALPIGLITAVSSWTTLLAGTLVAFVCAGAVALVLVMTGGSRRVQIPFGPAMIAGAAAVLLLQVG